MRSSIMDVKKHQSLYANQLEVFRCCLSVFHLVNQGQTTRFYISETKVLLSLKEGEESLVGKTAAISGWGKVTIEFRTLMNVTLI